jgi:hypothetical protein
MERERIASRRHPKMTPTGKRKALGIQTGFRVPRHPFPVARPEIPVQQPNAKKTAEPAIANPDAFGIVAHGVKPASDCAATVFKGLALLAPSAGMPGARAMG